MNKIPEMSRTKHNKKNSPKEAHPNDFFQRFAKSPIGMKLNAMYGRSDGVRKMRRSRQEQEPNAP